MQKEERRLQRGEAGKRSEQKEEGDNIKQRSRETDKYFIGALLCSSLLEVLGCNKRVEIFENINDIVRWRDQEIAPGSHYDNGVNFKYTMYWGGQQC